MNRSTAPRSVSLVWPDAAFTEAELTDPYHMNENVVSKGQKSQDAFLLPPGSILTLTNVPLGRLREGAF